jgi:hypothetical protein
MRLYWLIAVAVPCLVPPAARLTAEESPAVLSPAIHATTNVVEALGTSPVETFRKLLAMTTAARERFLTNYPPEKREQILQKVREYEALPVEMRELRLRVTALRWYLVPLLQAPPEKRAELLKSVPEPYQQWVATRLDEWDMWPPGLKDEVLEYETLMHYFIGRNAEVQRPTVFEDLPEAKQLDLELKLADWGSLPLGQREQMYGSFRHYFELSDAEQQKILATLSESEREKTEQVVNSIERWPKSRQEAYLAACRQYVEMSPAERRNFMKNAQRWQKMAPAERQAWRDLVQQLSMARTMAAGPVPLALPIGPRVPLITKTNPAGAAVK